MIGPEQFGNLVIPIALGLGVLVLVTMIFMKIYFQVTMRRAKEAFARPITQEQLNRVSDRDLTRSLANAEILLVEYDELAERGEDPGLDRAQIFRMVSTLRGEKQRRENLSD